MTQLPWEAALGFFFDGLYAGVGLTLVVLGIADWIRARRRDGKLRGIRAWHIHTDGSECLAAQSGGLELCPGSRATSNVEEAAQ